MKVNRNALHGSAGRNIHFQRGNMLVQTMLALVIAGIILVPSVRMFAEQKGTASSQAAITEIQGVVQRAQATWGALNQYGSVTTALAVQGGVTPDGGRIVGTNTAQNRYQGLFAFAPAQQNVANDSLVITYARVPAGDCADIVGGVDNLTTRVQIGAATPKAFNGSLSLATLVAACDGAGATADILFTIPRQ